MNSAVVCFPVLDASLPFTIVEMSPILPPVKTNLTRCGRGCLFTGDNNFFTIMHFLLSIVIMITHFKVRFRDYIIPSGISIAPVNFIAR
jgi:hypothetical protein